MRKATPYAIAGALMTSACSGAGVPQPDPTPTRGEVSSSESAGPSAPDPAILAPLPVASARAALPTATTDAAASPLQPKLAVEGEGLRWFLPPNGAARPIPFGTLQADVLASLQRVRGPAALGLNQDCGAGPVGYANWPDGLSVVFQRDRFVGWGLDGRAAGALATADGVGPGTTRAELESAYASISVQRTSLGSEFTAGHLHGVLDGAGPRARVTDMWAGVSCVAR